MGLWFHELSLNLVAMNTIALHESVLIYVVRKEGVPICLAGGHGIELNCLVQCS